MSSSERDQVMRRRHVVALLAASPLALASLAGCGFHPLYADQPALGYDPTLAAIEVRPAPDRIGQILVTTLREELNPRGASPKPRYVLNVGISASRSDLGIMRNNTSSYGEVTLTADLTLSDAGSKNIVLHDSIRMVSSFDVPLDAYAATIAEQKAREDGAADLGREIAQRVAIYFHARRSGQGT